MIVDLCTVVLVIYILKLPQHNTLNKIEKKIPFNETTLPQGSALFCKFGVMPESSLFIMPLTTTYYDLSTCPTNVYDIRIWII